MWSESVEWTTVIATAWRFAIVVLLKVVEVGSVVASMAEGWGVNSRGLVARAPVASCVSAVARGVGTYCAEAAIVPKQAMMREKMYCFMMMVIGGMRQG